eukprot:g1242.t1
MTSKSVSVADFESYNKWKRQQASSLDDKPCAAVIMVSNTELLFWKQEGLPWLARARCELPSREKSGNIVASYIGCLNGDKDEFYDMFKEAMHSIGIYHTCHVKCDPEHDLPSRSMKTSLENSDLVVVGGGSQDCFWENFAKMDNAGLKERIQWRYYDGAVIIAVGAAVDLCGRKTIRIDGDEICSIRTGFGFLPVIVGLERNLALSKEYKKMLDEKSESFRGWNDVDEQYEYGRGLLYGFNQTRGGQVGVGIAISSRGGLIFNIDGTLEPVRTMATEYRWNWAKESVEIAYLTPPPGSTSLLVAVSQTAGLQKWFLNKKLVEENVEKKSEYEYSLQEEEKQLRSADKYYYKMIKNGCDLAEKYKMEGNIIFKNAKQSKTSNSLLLQSLEKYKSGIKYNPMSLPLQLNMSQTLLKLEPVRAVEAFQFANNALRIASRKTKKTNKEMELVGKAWFRRGVALSYLGDEYASFAVADMEESQRIAPELTKSKIFTQLLANAHEKDKKVRENYYYQYIDQVNSLIESIGKKEPSTLCLRSKCKDDAILNSYASCDTNSFYKFEKKLFQNLNDPMFSHEERYMYEHVPPRALWLWKDLLKKEKFSNLTCLQINIHTFGSDGCTFLCKGLRNHKSLTILSLAGCYLRPEGAKALGNALAENDTLTTLDISSTGIKDRGIKWLVEEGLIVHPVLCTLMIRNIGITEKGIEYLCNEFLERKNCELEELYLDHNQLRFDSIRHISKCLKRNESLEKLSLCNNLLGSDAVIRMLKAGMKHENLKIVDLRGIKISRTTAKTVQNQLQYHRLEILLCQQNEKDDEDDSFSVWKQPFY